MRLTNTRIAKRAGDEMAKSRKNPPIARHVRFHAARGTEPADGAIDSPFVLGSVPPRSCDAPAEDGSAPARSETRAGDMVLRRGRG
ncbi:hypothetical protein GCM10010921_28550 [Microbacterium album]|uniref:Uncharacterized protein n=1 Tax=Microbacterium album TaxID=2053191 RepID=A0A917MNM7_9MICO|nr:hypothetical protein GCM10010921_28550 [Microbacterium album]